MASYDGKRAKKMHGPIAQVALARRMLVAGVKVHTRKSVARWNRAIW
jgi:hypothetical protein